MAWLVVGLPLIVWTARLIADGWVPEGDVAVAAVKTHDAFGPHLQLLGMPSTAGNEVAGANAHHLGPITFQWGWSPYVLTGHEPAGLLIGSCLLVLALAGVGLRAAQTAADRDGLVALTATFLVIAVVLRAELVTAWNPYPMLVGLPALVAIGAAVLTGRRWWWTLFAAVGTIVAQAHLVGALLAVVIWIAVVGVGVRRRLPIRPARIDMVASALVLAMCWWAPLLDATTREPSNIDHLWSYVSGERTGEQAVAVPPWIALGLEVVVATALMRSRRAERHGPIADITAWTVWTMVAVTLLFPNRTLYLVFAAGVLVLGLMLLVPRPWSRPASRFVALAGVGVLVTVAVALPPLIDLRTAAYTATRDVTGSVNDLLATVPQDEPLLVRGEGFLAAGSVSPGVQAALVAQGRWAARHEFATDPDQAFRREVEDGPHVVVAIRDVTDDPGESELPAGADVLGRAEVHHRFGDGGRIDVVVARVG